MAAKLEGDRITIIAEADLALPLTPSSGRGIRSLS